MLKITLQLTNASIDKAIADLTRLKTQVENAPHKLLKYIADSGVEVAKANVRNIDTGATLGSIHAVMYAEDNKAVIIAGEHAVWLEFGTGVDKNSGYPLPLPIGTTDGIHPIAPPKESTRGGWLYPSTDPRYEIIDRNGNGTGLAFTHGIKANKFMYKALCKIRSSAPKWAESIYKGIK